MEINISISNMSPSVKEYATRYYAAKSKLPSDKWQIMTRIISACQDALLSYHTLDDDLISPNDRLVIAASFARKVLAQCEDIKKSMNKTTDDEFEDAIQWASDWLWDNGLYGCPIYVDSKGTKITKTAHGMISDMKRNISTLHEYYKASQETSGNDRSRNPNRQDDKSTGRNSNAPDGLFRSSLDGSRN